MQINLPSLLFYTFGQTSQGVKSNTGRIIIKKLFQDADFATIPENMRFPKKIWPEAIIYFQAV